MATTTTTTTATTVLLQYHYNNCVITCVVFRTIVPWKQFRKSFGEVHPIGSPAITTTTMATTTTTIATTTVPLQQLCDYLFFFQNNHTLEAVWYISR